MAGMGLVVESEKGAEVQRRSAFSSTLVPFAQFRE